MQHELEGLQPGTPAYRRLLVALFFIGVATFAQLYSPQGLLPLIAVDLGVSPDQSALMISSATLGLALGVIPWSYIGDAAGRKQAMLVAISLACAFAVLTVIMPTFWLALGMRFIEGFMLGGVPALAVAYLNEEVGAKAAAVAAGTYISGTTIGGFSGRIIAAPIGDQLGWKTGMLVVTGIAVACVLIFLRTAPAARHFVPRRSRFTEAAGQLFGNLRSPALWVIYLQGFLTMGGFVAMYNYLAFHLVEPPFLMPLWLTSFIFLAYLAGTLSSPRAGALASKLGRKPVLITGNLVMLGGVVLTLVPQLWVIILGVVVMTAGFFAAHAVASGWAGASAVAGRSQSASLYNLGYYGGSSVFGYLGGSFLHWAGWSGTVGMVAALAVLATVLVIAVLPKN
ncbi:MFS transporter [Nesterenkonia alkaliphila]|uniref:MFS transporter n=1 Tax=Nesterenkonia alkaliphila TaxID=1463631 RepID=A0A7K1UEG4_9MICC|nr:MFS transporter [Nesterenkonia alkaliphila]MVT24870.1 MFS transporter [Nesterenkonia alkaliphila]GFZ92671.1 MFS transporter [Nesterenkonia alkaliphila]